MNKSLNVFLSVLLCAVLCVGVLTSLSTTDESASQYSQKEHTSSIPTNTGTPTISFGTGASGDVLAVPMSSRRSSRERYLQPSWRSTGVANLQVFSRSANSTGMLSHPSLQGGDGGRLFTHMSSSQTMKSFGGGNASAGSAGGFRSNGQGAIAQASGISSPLSVNSVSYAPVLHTSSSASGDEMLAVAQASNVASVSSYAGMGYTTATYGTSTYGTASYGATASRISGRKNSTNGNSILTWLAQYGQQYGTKTGDDENGYTYSYDYYQLKNAYDAYCRYMQDHWDEMWGTSLPSFDEWLLWFQGNEGSHSYRGDMYNWVPVGDYYPLLILAMLYVGYMVIRRRKQQVLEN